MIPVWTVEFCLDLNSIHGDRLVWGSHMFFPLLVLSGVLLVPFFGFELFRFVNLSHCLNKRENLQFSIQLVSKCQ
uniref:Putative ovule protein n=1 Tax=Solanum chacoense TaxID=4108 RepID=A0A0V0GSG5_SOLCH